MASVNAFIKCWEGKPEMWNVLVSEEGLAPLCNTLEFLVDNLEEAVKEFEEYCKT